MNIASIDIGSNTVLLLIAEINPPSTEIKTILNKYEAPRLGKGLKKNGKISEESISQLMNVLSEYKDLIDKYDCKKIICTATNAMRIATNSDLIVRKVKEKFNFKIRIIAGEKEAELSYLGASSVLPNVQNKMVIDIGGGSTEIIYGNNDKIILKKSFPIGAINSTEEFINSYPPKEDDIFRLIKNIENTFAELKEKIPPGTPLIAIAGTPTTLSAINLNLKEYDDKKVEGSKLTNTTIDKFIKEFSSTTPNEILNKYGKIISGREDVILAGTIILKTVARFTTNRDIFVSGKGIRYGSIVEFIKLSQG